MIKRDQNGYRALLENDLAERRVRVGILLREAFDRGPGNPKHRDFLLTIIDFDEKAIVHAEAELESLGQA
jgi:hypothetical protein